MDLFIETFPRQFKTLVNPTLLMINDTGKIEGNDDHIGRRLDKINHTYKQEHNNIIELHDAINHPEFSNDHNYNLRVLKEGLDLKTLDLHSVRSIADPSTKIWLSNSNYNQKRLIRNINNADDISLIKQQY